jgi:hypothetical protein
MVREAVQAAGTLALVTAGLAAALRGLDRLPELVRPERRGWVRVDSLEAAARRFGAPIPLPAYFPDTIAWPPAAIRVRTTPPAAVVVVFTGRDGRSERLRLCVVRGPDVPPDLMLAGRRLHRVQLDLGGAPATLDRVQVDDGSIRHELTRPHEAGTMLLRYAGGADELVAMARSLRWRRP